MELLGIGELLVKESKNKNDEKNYLEDINNVYDEVRLHSKVIYNLLKNKTNQIEFNKLINIENSFNEYQIFREYKNIDILMKNNNKSIIIENKILASDQDKQLNRYFNTMVSENYSEEDIFIIYLTLYGDEPSKNSLGILNVKDIQCLSYKYDILKWLKTCKINAMDKPNEREFIDMYIKIIKKIVNGGSMNQEEIKMTEEINKNYSRFNSARLINTCFDNAKIKLQMKFWNRVYNELLNNNYNIISPIIDDGQIEKYYKSNKNRFWYGITIKLNNGNEFKIEIEDRIYFGIKRSDNAIEIDMRKINTEYKKNNWWIGYRYSKLVTIDFILMDSDELEYFFDEDKFTEYINDFIEEISCDITSIEENT